jgi:cytochrome c biogenesis protein
MAQVDKQPVPSSEPGVIEALWDLLSSLRMALSLILLLAGVTLAGTLLVQAPSYATQSNTVFQQWLETVRPKYGLWTQVLGMSGLLNVFRSPLFALLLGLLSLNVIICTLDRWARIWRVYSRPVVPVEAAYFDNAKLNSTFRLKEKEPSAAAGRLVTALRRRGYRVRTSPGDGIVSLYGDRYAWSRFGTFFNHAGIVLIFVGGVVGGILGFRVPGFVIPEGSTKAVGYGTNLSVYVDSFGEESYQDGRPKDYWSDVILFDGDQEVVRRTIRVNDPLAYKLDPLGLREVRFHQASFGNAVSLSIVDDAGRPVFDDTVALAYNDADFGDRPVGYLNLYHQGVVLEIVGRVAGVIDPNLDAGDILVRSNQVMGEVMRPTDMAKLSMRQPRKIGNLTVTFNRERQFTGLQVVYDPGNRIVWLACIFIVAGIMAVFYFPVQRLRALCLSDSTGVTVRMAGISERAMGFEEAFRRLTNNLISDLGAETTTESKPASAVTRGRRGR